MAYKTGDKTISKEDAKRVYEYLGYDFDFTQFYKGINVELEHADVTDGSLVKTAMIAAAHLREVPNYYDLLEKHVEKKAVSEELVRQLVRESLIDLFKGSTPAKEKFAYIRRQGGTFFAWTHDFSGTGKRPDVVNLGKFINRADLANVLKKSGYSYFKVHGSPRNLLLPIEKLTAV